MRFNFQNVTLDTRVIRIDEIPKDFDFASMFSMTSDDMVIEKKMKQSIEIKKDKKPKIGMTSNFVLKGLGYSHERRKHVVEFGNFWNRCGSRGIAVSDVLGKRLIEDFDSDDWNLFFNYGFHCVQQYLSKGLVEPSLSSYKRKQLIASIEGVNGTGEVVEWIEDWIDTPEASEGEPLKDLFNRFLRQYPLMSQSWNQTSFNSALFDYAKATDGLEYNPHLKNKGNSCSARRWRKGSRENQQVWVKIEKVES